MVGIKTPYDAMHSMLMGLDVTVCKVGILLKTEATVVVNCWSPSSHHRLCGTAVQHR